MDYDFEMKLMKFGKMVLDRETVIAIYPSGNAVIVILRAGEGVEKFNVSQGSEEGKALLEWHKQFQDAT